MFPEWRRDEYVLTTDPARMDVGAIHAYLVRSYWAPGIPLEIVRRSPERYMEIRVPDVYQAEGAEKSRR